MRRHRLHPEEIPEVTRGLLLRMQELARARTDLQAAGTAYMAFKRLTSQEKGRPRHVEVTWNLIDYVVNSLL
jgi:acyl CoA:acetate/3-ketoacid CoA transferase